MATFGQTGNNGSTSASSGDSDLLNKDNDAESTPATNGTLDKVVARVWMSGGDTTTIAKGLVYDASGNLLAVSDEVTVNNTSEAEVEFPFSGAARIALTAGTKYTYGLMWDDPGTGDINWSRNTTSSASWKNTITYPNAADPHATGGVSGPIDMYVSYIETQTAQPTGVYFFNE